MRNLKTPKNTWDGERCVFGSQAYLIFSTRLKIEMCVRFTGLFDILNSTKNRLDTSSYSHNLEYLKEFHKWFSEWKIESINRKLATLPMNPTTYQSMVCFFRGEASEDCLSMIK